MSLLMDAIKRAEGAKENKDLPPLSLDRTQDMSAPLAEAAVESTPPVQPSHDGGERFNDKAAAENLFAAKMFDDRKNKIRAAMVAAGLLALGALGYYWQSKGQSNSVLKDSPPPAANAAATVAANPASSPLVIMTPAIDANPAKAQLPKAVQEPQEEARPAAAASAVEAAAPANVVKIEKTPAKLVLNPLAMAGYKAMQGKDLVTAQKDYAALYRQDPQNRDALLGLAAISVKNGKKQQAEIYYGKVLELDPQNATATAGLIDLKGQVDPTDGESKLKSMIKNDPDSGALYFSLGNRYASESMWAEAQQAYFEAFSKDPQNADFAFNLAVALDHLNQNKLALDYYWKALTLSANGLPSFDPAQVVNRIHELE